MTLKIGSINAHGLRDPQKKNNILQWIIDQHFDIIFLQETHLTDKSFLSTNWDGEIYLSPGQLHSAGVCTLISKKLSHKLLSNTFDPCGRYVNTIIEIDDSSLQLCNIYAPNHVSNRKEFFESLPTVIKGGIPTILGGDLNCIEDIYLDKSGGDSDLAVTALHALQNLTTLLNMKDVYRHLNPSARIFTWTSADSSVSCRLDRFYVTDDIFTSTELAKITFFPYSDHNTPFLSFRLPNTSKRGPGSWKFNTSLLKNPQYTDKVTRFWKHWQTKKQEFRNLNIWWDFGKKKIKHLTIKFSKKIAREKRSKRSKLERDLIHYIQLNNNKTFNSKIDSINNELTELEQSRLNGAKIRSKERFYNEFEKSSAYFYSLENSRQTKKVITELRNNNNRTINSTKGILDELASFYENLYTEEPLDNPSTTFLLDQIDTSLSEEEKSKLDKNLDKKECHEALSAMKRNKSPGADGLPAEFYCSFWFILGDDLVDVLNFSLHFGLLPESMRSALIRLLYKKGDKLNLVNWRPISLLNTDYKIGTKALSNRLKQALPFLLNEDQTCTIPGRTIFDNLYLVRDTIAYVKQKNIPLAIIKIDQEKAFDRVNWSFLQDILTKMNFGPVFKGYIASLYTNVTSAVLNNGHSSRKFLLNRGVRQGCPLSPLLYCLVAETLGSAIRKNESINGLPLPGCPSPCKISQYADDTTLFIPDEPSIFGVFDTLKTFEKGSGSKVNFSKGKSEALWLNKHRTPTSNQIPHLTWVDHSMEILGIHFGSPAAVTNSFSKRVNKLAQRLEAWSKRNLSLNGKVMILKTLGLSSITYISSVFPIPDSILRRINSLIFTFLWSNKNELVKREVVFLPLTKGGLNLTNMRLKNQALALRCINTITDPDSKSKWIFLARYWIARTLSKHSTLWSFLRSNQTPNSLYRPPFYCNVVSLVNRCKPVLDLFINNEFNVNFIYKQLISMPVIEPRAQVTWEIILQSRQLSWPTIWKTSISGISTGHENDVAWKITHRVLKTLDTLRSWGIKVDGLCKSCHSPETIEHVFLECPIAIETWIHFKKFILHLGGPDFEASTDSLLLRIFPTNTPRANHTLLTYLIKLILYNIWMSRCKVLYEKKVESSKKIIYRIRSEIQQRITVAFNTRHSDASKVLKIFIVDSLFASVVNDLLVLNI